MIAATAVQNIAESWCMRLYGVNKTP